VNRRQRAGAHCGTTTAPELIAAFARAWNVEDERRAHTAAHGLVSTRRSLRIAARPNWWGQCALSTSIGEFRRAFPAAIVSFGRPDEHGGFVRVARTAEWNKGQPALVGQDFAQLAYDGRIRPLVSFDKDSSPTESLSHRKPRDFLSHGHRSPHLYGRASPALANGPAQDGSRATPYSSRPVCMTRRASTAVALSAPARADRGSRGDPA
jgi:hypothetical protein